jgi:hypothetical protein
MLEHGGLKTSSIRARLGQRVNHFHWLSSLRRCAITNDTQPDGEYTPCHFHFHARATRTFSHQIFHRLLTMARHRSKVELSPAR